MNRYTFETFDNMTNEELKKLIVQDAKKTIKEQMDEELLLYALELLENSGEYDEDIPDVDDARISFLENYLDIGENKESEPKPRRRWGVSILKTACIAVVTTLVLLMGTVTAAAAGYNVYDNIAEWTHNTFEFHNTENIVFRDDSEVAYSLEGVYRNLYYGHCIEEAVLPKYLPEGYSCRDYIGGGYNGNVHCMFRVSNGEDFISFEYLTATYSGGLEYAKDDSDPEVYETGGIAHYIMMYNGKYKAIWRNGIVECSIYGVESYEELIKIIDSIYE